ncbi:MAG: carboxylating nicotinate-nucleotide diphosphorylase, partial [Terriglobia bacterium]
MAANESATTGIAVEQTLDWRSAPVTAIVQRALEEDLGGGDLTTEGVLPAPVAARATFIANEVSLIAGLPLTARVFELLDPNASFLALVPEGAMVSRGHRLAEVRGDARALLKGERVALNFLQRLSGIATLTRRYVSRIAGTKAKILDTRKTAPGLRLLERYAVRVGGGSNHRMGLYDAILIKENHAELAGGIAEAVRRARSTYGHHHPIQAEVRDEAELRAALEAGADALLLDNMAPAQVKLGVEVVAGRAWVEASGNIRVENVRAYADTDVDYISVGALTHSADSIDISLDLVREPPPGCRVDLDPHGAIGRDVRLAFGDDFGRRRPRPEPPRGWPPASPFAPAWIPGVVVGKP